VERQNGSKKKGEKSKGAWGRAEGPGRNQAEEPSGEKKREEGKKTRRGAKKGGETEGGKGHRE